MRQPLDRDEALYAFIGSRLGPGFMPYRDVFEHKQPLVHPVYRLIEWIAPRSVIGVRVAAALAAAATAALVFALGRRVVGDLAAFLAAALVVVASASRWVEGADLNTEHLLALVAVPCVLLGLRGRAVWSGVLGGLAVLAKATGGLAALAGLLAARRRGVSWIASAAVPVLVTVAAYAGLGALPEVYRGNVSYNLAYIRRFPALPWWRWLTFPAPLQALVAVAVVVAAWRLARSRGKDETTWTLLAWLAGAIAGAKLGRREAPHYFAPLIAPAALLAASAPLAGRRRLAAALAMGLAMAALAVPFAADVASRVGVRPDVLARRQYGPQSRVWAGADDAGAWIRSRARSGDRMFVTEAEPVFLWLSGVAPASRYVFDYPREVDAGRHLRTVRRDLSARPPEWLVLPTGGPWPGYIQSLPREDYALSARFGPTDVYRRFKAPRPRTRQTADRSPPGG